MSITEQNSLSWDKQQNSAERGRHQTTKTKMNNKKIMYEAPEIEIVEMVLENGIAYTITHNTFEIEDLEEGGDLGTF